MYKKVKLAILGGEGHVKRFGDLINSYEESRVIGIWNSNLSVGSELAGCLECPFYSDVDELLALKELDGVIISVPNSQKTGLMLKAAAAGKGIFVEKPLATSIADAAIIRNAVKESGVPFYMTDPFVDPPTIFMKDFLKTGKLGKLQCANVEFCCIMPHLLGDSEGFYENLVKEMGGGIMCDTGVHPLHAIHYLFGMPESVYARFCYTNEAAERAGYEHFVTAVLNYRDGFTVTFNCSSASPRGCNRFEIRGVKGTIIDSVYGRHDMPYTVDYWCFEEMPKIMHTLPEHFSVPVEDMPQVPDEHVRYFVRMLAEDIPNEAVGVDPLSTHGTGVDTAFDLVRLSTAIRESAGTGMPVSFK